MHYHLFFFVYAHILPKKDALMTFEKLSNCRLVHPIARRALKNEFLTVENEID